MNRFSSFTGRSMGRLALAVALGAATGPHDLAYGTTLESQTISFPATSSQVVGTTLPLGATATSDLPVSFASTTTSVCTVSGTIASMVAAGTCTIRATQAGNSAYAPAPPVAESFAVSGKPQTITFANPGAQTVGTPLTLKATTSSGFPVTFVSTSTKICMVSEPKAFFITAGTCTIRAVQAGNRTYAAAPPVSRSFTVNAASGNVYALPEDRMTVWNPGLMSKGGIPSAHWPVYTTLQPSGGDDTTQINNALVAAHAAHPTGVVVLLAAGTFVINTANYIAIQTNNTVLRGSGAGATWIRKTNGAVLGSNESPDETPIIIVGPSRWPLYQNNTQLLTAEGLKGSNSITVADGSYFSPGMFALLDEVSGAVWETDPQGRGKILANGPWSASSPMTSPDVVWWVHNPAFVDDDPVAVGTTPTAANNWASLGNGSDAASWFSRQDRPQAEVKEIASVSGNVVTFTSPLHKDFRVSHYAELTPPGDGGDHPSVHVTDSGVEALSVYGGTDGNIRFENAAYSWARNVENTMWIDEGFAVDGSFRVEIRDSYIHEGAFPYPGGGGYNISLSNGSAEVLIENNISVLDNKVMVARSSGAGSVVAYNYMDMGFIGYDDTWDEIGLNGSHMVGGYQMLFEGNWGFNFDSDSTHGSATRHTVYRNWLRGWRNTFTDYVGCTGGTAHGCSPQEPTVDDAYNMADSIGGPYRAAGGCRYSYYFNFVGNVLGESGQMGGWVEDAPAFSYAGKGAIWYLGWDPDSPYPPNDPYVAPTDVRDGNWDFLSNTQQWLTDPSMSSDALPDSLYLPGKPAFFGSNPWPWVNPATGVTYTLPAKARFDAGTPNQVP